MAEIEFDVTGSAGLITFTRPKALNALSLSMVTDMSGALDEWAKDERITRVVVRGEGKAFSAGGDVRFVYDAPDRAADYFWAEYRLDLRVKHFPKPYIALIDGIVMGGGAGVSMHGTQRVGGEAVQFAMPEVTIGLFPDVGIRHLLAGLDVNYGRYLALTGARIGRDAAADCGLLTHPVPSERMADAMDRAIYADAQSVALDELTVKVEARPTELVSSIEKAFAVADPREVLARLDEIADRHPALAEAGKTMRSASPTSLAVTARAMERAERQDFDDVLKDDYRIVRKILEAPDFFEGIRARIVDKDNEPRWSPGALDAVDEARVAAHFEVPDGGDLNCALGWTTGARLS